MTEKERELLHSLMKKTIEPEVFLDEFTVDISSNPTYIRELLEKAFIDQEAYDVEFLLTAIFKFNLFNEDHINILCKLMNESWHFQHENIASIFQKMKSESTIDSLYKTALAKFEYLEYDEAFALAVKCIWALGNINTPEARVKLEMLAQSEKEVIRSNAIYQLNRYHK